MRTAWTQRLAAGAIAALTGMALGAAGAAADDTPLSQLVIRSVDGRGNNLQHSTWGQAGVPYRRVAPANYADGISKQVTPAKPDRYVSNRVFNDLGQNLFSEHGLSQWGWLWGQFIDHDLGSESRRPGSPHRCRSTRQIPSSCSRTISARSDSRGPRRRRGPARTTSRARS
jgi:hypothetical protein